MIKIEIKDSAVSERHGSKNGRDWSMRTQEAWAHTVSRNGNLNPYPEKISINLDDDQQGYPVGQYQLADQSIYVGDFGTLRLGRPVLIPLRQEVKQVA